MALGWSSSWSSGSGAAWSRSAVASGPPPGTGADTVCGGTGADTLNGGDGDDLLADQDASGAANGCGRTVDADTLDGVGGLDEVVYFAR